MIIAFKSGLHSQDEYVVSPRAPLTVAGLRDRMLRRAKVTEGSYAYRLVDDLHSAIFVESLDLKADYEAYFAREYGSFDEYLRRRARLPSAVAAKLTKLLDESTGMYHFCPAYAFLADTYGLDFLTRLVEDLPVGEAS
jgi:hypothetical protein